MAQPLIYCLILFTLSALTLGQNEEGKIILDTIQKELDVLQERLKIDLNEKFLKLSAQLDENDRRVKKTLTIFESEWSENRKRLSDLEERQQRVEQSVMKLTSIVNELRYGQSNLTPNPTELPQQPKEVKLSQKVPNKFISNSNSTIKNYLLVGTKDDFKLLETIPPEEQPELTSIRLEYVQFSPEVLLSSLQNCSNLKSLKLIKVKLLDDFERKVHLPQLEEFVLEQVGVLEFSNHSIFSKWSEVDDYLRGFDEGSLSSSIFFYKDDANWNIYNISNLETSVDIVVDGVKLFGINHERGELNSMLRFSQELVRHLRAEFILRRLSISAWRLDISSFPDTLTQLNFNYIHNTRDGQTNLTEKFENLKELQELNAFIGNHGNSSDGGWIWSSLPKTLKNLTIRFSDVKYKPELYEKLSLDNLYFHYCKLDRSIAENFHKAFDSAKVAVSFRVENQTSRLEHELLRNMLRTNVTWIFMQNFRREQPGGKDINTYWTIEIFLFDSGVSQFAQNFILQKRNGSWEGWNISKEGQLLLTYQLVGTDQFVSFGAYKKIIG